MGNQHIFPPHTGDVTTIDVGGSCRRGTARPPRQTCGCISNICEPFVAGMGATLSTLLSSDKLKSKSESKSTAEGDGSVDILRISPHTSFVGHVAGCVRPLFHTLLILMAWSFSRKAGATDRLPTPCGRRTNPRGANEFGVTGTLRYVPKATMKTRRRDRRCGSGCRPKTRSRFRRQPTRVLQNFDFSGLGAVRRADLGIAFPSRSPDHPTARVSHPLR